MKLLVLELEDIKTIATNARIIRVLVAKKHLEFMPKAEPTLHKSSCRKADLFFYLPKRKE